MRSKWDSLLETFKKKVSSKDLNRIRRLKYISKNGGIVMDNKQFGASTSIKTKPLNIYSKTAILGGLIWLMKCFY